MTILFFKKATSTMRYRQYSVKTVFSSPAKTPIYQWPSRIGRVYRIHTRYSYIPTLLRACLAINEGDSGLLL